MVLIAYNWRIEFRFHRHTCDQNIWYYAQCMCVCVFSSFFFIHRWTTYFLSFNINNNSKKKKVERSRYKKYNKKNERKRAPENWCWKTLQLAVSLYSSQFFFPFSFSLYHHLLVPYSVDCRTRWLSANKRYRLYSTYMYVVSNKHSRTVDYNMTLITIFVYTSICSIWRLYSTRLNAQIIV